MGKRGLQPYAPTADCVCGTCGKAFILLASKVRLGKGKYCSAPCQHKGVGLGKRTHGHWAAVKGGTATYKAWVSMKERCTNPNNRMWPHYGGRGIGFCERWTDFVGFLADMGEKPAGLSLDRIDNDGNYEPANCRWADNYTQNQNRRTSRMLDYEGETLCLTVLARRLGLGVQCLRMRIQNGWPSERWAEPSQRPS